jgi:hypothetical protein
MESSAKVDFKGIDKKYTNQDTILVNGQRNGIALQVYLPE